MEKQIQIGKRTTNNRLQGGGNDILYSFLCSKIVFTSWQNFLLQHNLYIIASMNAPLQFNTN